MAGLPTLWDILSRLDLALQLGPPFFDLRPFPNFGFNGAPLPPRPFSLLRIVSFNDWQDRDLNTLRLPPTFSSFPPLSPARQKRVRPNSAPSTPLSPLKYTFLRLPAIPARDRFNDPPQSALGGRSRLLSLAGSKGFHSRSEAENAVPRFVILFLKSLVSFPTFPPYCDLFSFRFSRDLFLYQSFFGRFDSYFYSVNFLGRHLSSSFVGLKNLILIYKKAPCFLLLPIPPHQPSLCMPPNFP